MLTETPDANIFSEAFGSLCLNFALLVIIFCLVGKGEKKTPTHSCNL